MRDPSLHITESTLEKILEQLLELNKKELKSLARDITRLAKKEALQKRSVTISSKMVEKKVVAKLQAKPGDTKKLAELIYLIRYKKGHRGITKIKEGSAEYTKLKELVPICLSFCEEFKLSKKKGFTEYLQIGVDRIKSSMNLTSKLINMGETIFAIYGAEQLIIEDKNKKLTKEVVRYYTTLILERTGILPRVENDPRVYSKFIEVSKTLKKLGVTPRVYIDAQFSGLEWTDSYPEPTQLVGDKAIDRVNKYIYKNKINTKNTEEDKENIKLKLKNLGK